MSKPPIKSSTPTDLTKFRRKQQKAKAQGKTLCKSGFHKWEFDGSKQFDVKQGRLVSVQICQRCRQKRNYIK